MGTQNTKLVIREQCYKVWESLGTRGKNESTRTYSFKKDDIPACMKTKAQRIHEVIPLLTAVYTSVRILHAIIEHQISKKLSFN